MFTRWFPRFLKSFKDGKWSVSSLISRYNPASTRNDLVTTGLVVVAADHADADADTSAIVVVTAASVVLIFLFKSLCPL